MPRKQASRTSRTRRPKADVTMKVADGTCLCGCGVAAKRGRSFAQGHDAKLHSQLNAAYRKGARTLSVNGETVTLESRYATSGWSFPPAAKAKGAAKVAA